MSPGSRGDIPNLCTNVCECRTCGQVAGIKPSVVLNTNNKPRQREDNMTGVVDPGGDGNIGGVAAPYKPPGCGHAVQHNLPGCCGITRVRTASSTCRKPERAGVKTAPEVKRMRTPLSTCQGATPVVTAATHVWAALFCYNGAMPAMLAATCLWAAVSHCSGALLRRRGRNGVPYGGRETKQEPSLAAASIFLTKLEANHFHRDAPGGEGDDNEIPLLNKPDDLDDESDNEGWETNISKCSPPPTMPLSVFTTPPPRKHGRPPKSPEEKKEDGV